MFILTLNQVVHLHNSLIKINALSYTSGWQIFYFYQTCSEYIVLNWIILRKSEYHVLISSVQNYIVILKTLYYCIEIKVLSLLWFWIVILFWLREEEAAPCVPTHRQPILYLLSFTMDLLFKKHMHGIKESLDSIFWLFLCVSMVDVTIKEYSCKIHKGPRFLNQQMKKKSLKNNNVQMLLI